MIVSKEKKALVLKLRDPNRVTSVIPTAKKFTFQGEEYVAVKHGLDEAKVLRNIGIAAPNPILYHYDWPGQFSPFDAQKEAAAFLSMEKRAFNLSDLGTGKTMATLWAYDYLRSVGRAKKALVITPLSTLERTWADEIFNHFPHLTSAVLYGPKEKRLELLKQDVDVYLINHDGIKIPGIVEALAEREDIDVVIVDEIAQVARNAGTDRFGALMDIINKQGDRRAWGLTGTPTPNAPTDAWAQCRLLVSDRVPAYFSRFRDKVMRQISQFKWVPRDNAVQVVHEAMQPAIRFSRDECVDLPPCTYQVRQVPLSKEQEKAYKTMFDTLCIEAASGTITAANEAVKAQKLIQVACLCYNTPVLTTDGWVSIQDVTSKHKVWDGIEWVSQKGAVHRGDKAVTSCFGVLMTDDHKVLTTRGWVTAKEVNHEQATARVSGPAGERLDRESVRLPDSCGTGRVYGKDRGIIETRNVAVQVRLRERGCASESISSYEASSNPTELWVPSRERQTQNDPHATVQCMDENEVSLFKSVRQRLEELRRARNNGVRTVDWLLSKLPRRYFRWLQERTDTWSEGQRRPLFAGELPVGDTKATGEQHAKKPTYRHPERAYDSNRSGGCFRHKEDDATREAFPVQVASGESTVNPGNVVPVFDLVDCGPRNRFVVLGQDMRPLIVHNCGTVYDGDGNVVSLDATPRMDTVVEVIEEAHSKVIVFVPFVSVVHSVAEHIRRAGYTVEEIHGGVSKNDRDRIFSDFMHSNAPQVLVAQPAAMSHGLTLTAASTIIWYAPIASNETWEQANARITRPGQKLNQLIVMVEGTDIERKYYKRLKEKQRVQGLLLDMIQDSRVV